MSMEVIKMQTNKGYINDLERGKGGVKYYAYFANGLRLYRKCDVAEAINLSLVVYRKDLIINELSKFNYTTKMFEVVKQ